MSKKPWRAGKDLAAVVENMEIGTGQRGDGKDAFVTQRQLAELKLAKMNGGSRAAGNGNGKFTLVPGLGQGVFPEPPPPAFPSVPRNVVVTGAFGYVLLEWDMPRYSGHSLTEIWRGTKDNLSDAVLVGTTPGQVYSDPVDPGWKGFYWIRFVNSAGVSGPYNAVEGTAAETKADTESIIQTIQSQINDSPIIKNLDEMWSIKATAGDIKAGIGLVAQPDGTTQIGLAAGSVFIFDPNKPDDQGRYAIPFAVVDGKVVIDEAAIREATINILSAQHIVADEVKAGVSITTPVLRSATIQNGKFTVDSNGNVNASDANLSNVTARGGVFYNISVRGLEAVEGTLSNVHILENCQIDGRLSAAHIEGDIAKTYVINGNSIYIPAQVLDMNLVCMMGDFNIRLNDVEQSSILSVEIARWQTGSTWEGGSPGHGGGSYVPSYDRMYIKVYRLNAGTPVTISGTYSYHGGVMPLPPHVIWMSKA